MFSKSIFTNKIEFKFALPKVYGGNTIILPLRVLTNTENELIKQGFLALPTDERTDEIFALFIRKSVCTLLRDEPTGIEDFPTDDRPLSERALEYFTVSDNTELQEFLDSVLFAAYLTHREVSEPEEFFRAVQDSGEKSDLSPQDAGGTPSTI